MWQYVANLSDSTNAILKDTVSLIAAIAMKHKELQALRDAFDTKQSNLEKIPS